MNHGDSRAANILIRLASYTPRVGRDAEEDFCTEGLAWCLDNSPKFRDGFVSLLPKRFNLERVQGVLHISTQQALSPDEGGEDEDGEKHAPEGSRFDMVLERPDHWAVVVECKIAEDPNLPQQLHKYRKAMRRNPRFSAISKKYVVSLTNSIEPPHGPSKAYAPDAHLSWSKIQKLAEDTARLTNKPPSPLPAGMASVCDQ